MRERCNKMYMYLITVQPVPRDQNDMYLKTVIWIDCNFQITCESVYCTVLSVCNLETSQVWCILIKNVTCNSNENMIAFAPKTPTIWCISRERTHARSAPAHYSACGSQSFVLSNLFLWHNESANFIRYHSISINSRSKPSSTNCVRFHIADCLLFPMGVLQTKTDILFYFFLCLSLLLKYERKKPCV